MSLFLASVAAGIWRDRRWSADQFSRLQQSRLTKLVRHARERVPFYLERYRHVDLDNFRLSDLPPVTKGEMMAEFADTVTDRAVTSTDVQRTIKAGVSDGFWIHGRYLLSVTSGTSGVLGHFLNDRRSWLRQSGLVMARTFRGRMGAASNLLPFFSGGRYRMAFLGSGNPGSICTQIGLQGPRLGSLLVDRRVFRVGAPFEENVAGLNHFRPRYVHGYSSYLERLARAQLAGELRIEPRFISLGSETVTLTGRDLVERAFPTAQVVEQYGATECPLLANQCPAGRLHTNLDCCIIEPMDDQGQPVPPGSMSQHLLITNLLNPVQPIIRYRVDDAVVVSDEPCLCGRNLPVIKIHGRASDTIWLKKRSGSYAPYTPLVFETLLHNCAGLHQYQLLYERQNELQFKVVPESDCPSSLLVERIRGRIETYLRQEGCAGVVKFCVDPVQEIERTAGQKVRSVRSIVPAPPDAERESGRADGPAPGFLRKAA